MDILTWTPCSLLQLFPLASMALAACFFCGSSGRVSSVQSLASQCWEAVSAALGLLAEVGKRRQSRSGASVLLLLQSPDQGSSRVLFWKSILGAQFRAPSSNFFTNLKAPKSSRLTLVERFRYRHLILDHSPCNGKLFN